MAADVSSPLATVVIPTHNRAAFLRQAVASVLDQTERRLVLVVADNASDDETPAVMAAFDDPRIRYVRRPENIGPNANFNESLDGVTTPYVTLLLDDDWWLPTYLEESVAMLDAHPRAGMVHSAFVEVGPSGETRQRYTEWTHGLRQSTVEPGPVFTRESMRWSGRVFMSSVLLRTAALPPVRFDPADEPFDDLGLWLQIALDWDVAFLARPLVAFRQHAESASAGEGYLTTAGYTRSLEGIAALREMKLRHLERHADRLSDVAGLRRLARERGRDELLATVWAVTRESRRLSETTRLLREAATYDRRVAVDPRAWRLLAASLLGPRVTARLKGAQV